MVESRAVAPYNQHSPVPVQREEPASSHHAVYNHLLEMAAASATEAHTDLGLHSSPVGSCSEGYYLAEVSSPLWHLYRSLSAVVGQRTYWEGATCLSFVHTSNLDQAACGHCSRYTFC